MNCCLIEQYDTNYLPHNNIKCCHNKNIFVKKRCYRDCRVKFGVPLDQVCKRDIPGPLLVSALCNSWSLVAYPSIGAKICK